MHPAFLLPILLSVASAANYSVDSLLNVYEPYNLHQVWNGEVRVSERCYQSMELFLDGLQMANSWALKMVDSSGRKPSGFFWGNDFWTGSSLLCKSLNGNHSDMPPPFPVDFHIAKVELNFTMDSTEKSHVISVGVCLPKPCSSEDVMEIIDLSTDKSLSLPRTVQILRVRSLHGEFSLWTDPTFIIIAVVSSIVFVLMVAGTAYDVLKTIGTKNNNCSSNQTSFPCCNYSYDITTGFKNEDVKIKVDGTTIATISNKMNGSAKAASVGNGTSAGDKTTVGNGTNLTNSTTIPNGDERNSNHVNLSQNQALPKTEQQDKKGDEKPALLLQILQSFSVCTNIKKIFDPTVGEDTLPCVHGLRLFSMLWVMLGHACITPYKYASNTIYRDMSEKNLFLQVILSAPFAVDTFFYISGLLVSFLYFRTANRVDPGDIISVKGVFSYGIQFIGILGYRFLRLTPPYLFALALVELSTKTSQANSIFDPVTDNHENCPKYWWRNVLFINNFYPVDEMCMKWSWYLSLDTQFFVLGVPILILAVNQLPIAAIIIPLVLVGSGIGTSYSAYLYDQKPSLEEQLANFDVVYAKPWSRISPYLIGLIIGWVLYKNNNRMKMNKFAVAVGWLLSSGCLLSLVFGLYNENLDRTTSAAYVSLSHTAWALGLGWITVACCTGYGGFINSILSWKYLYPFSRVTYCVYLLESLTIRTMLWNMDTPFHLSVQMMALLFIGHVVTAFLCALAVSLAFEAPVVTILRVVNPIRKRSELK